MFFLFNKCDIKIKQKIKIDGIIPRTASVHAQRIVLNWRIQLPEG